MQALLAKGKQTHPQLHATLKALRGTKVRLTLTNTSEAPAYVYRVNMPKDGELENNVFIVGVGTMSAGYKGRYVKRRAPGPSDFDSLAPGADLVADVDLADWYGLPSSGEVRVWFEAFHDDPQNKSVLWNVVSNDVTLKL